MRHRFSFKHLAFITLALALLACNLPLAAVTAPVAQNFLLATSNPNATSTATPFQPVTSTPRPTYLPPATATSTIPPTKAPTPIPTARPVYSYGKYPDGQVRIMVLGSDARPTGGGYRTDIMMLVSINQKQGTVTVLSFPRDLYVNIPGWGENRINTAMGYGGFTMLSATLETNFGVRPNYYVLANFTNFTAIIDHLGGVDVNASTTLTDRCKFPQLKPDGITCVVKPGITHMTGAMALWYVRSRKTTSDFDRERRSQEVLQAIFKKLFSLDVVSHIPELFDFYRKNVDTNLTLGDVAALAPVAAVVAGDQSKIRRYSIGPNHVTDYTVPENGAMVLLPNTAAIHALIVQAVLNP